MQTPRLCSVYDIPKAWLVQYSQVEYPRSHSTGDYDAVGNYCLHNETGPAVMTRDGSLIWMIAGQKTSPLSRDGTLLPTVIHANGEVEYYRNGCRIKGPENYELPESIIKMHQKLTLMAMKYSIWDQE